MLNPGSARPDVAVERKRQFLQNPPALPPPTEKNNMERTLILLKPDCVQRRLMGRIFARLEDKGLNIIAMQMLQISPELAKKHYAEHVNKPFYASLEKFITGGPVVAMIAEGWRRSAWLAR